MKFLIIQAKNKSWEKVKDLFFKAAKNKGVKLTCAFFKDLTLVYDKKVNLYIKGKDLVDFDLIYLRFIGRFLEEANIVAEYARQKDILLFDRVYKNGQDFDRKSFECLRLTDAGLSHPKTFIGDYQFLVQKAVELGFPLILKKTKGRKAEGVYKIKSLNNLKKLLRMYKKEDRLMIQEYIDNDFYLRLMVVGSEVIGAMKRMKSMGGSQGIKSESYQPTKKQAELAISGAKALNIDIAGIDMMVDKDGKNYILEVNRSSQYLTFMKRTGINAPEKIVEFFVKEWERLQ